MKRFIITIYQNKNDKLIRASSVTVSFDAESVALANDEAVKMDKGFGYNIYQERVYSITGGEDNTNICTMNT